MSESKLILHCGATEISRADLDLLEPPPATASWVPIKHAVVIDSVLAAMEQAQFRQRALKIGVSRGGHRLFATIDTETNLNSGSVTLAVAVVNSTDKSLPMKFIAGSRVFCCDNLALRSDLMAPVRRKHTRFGLDRFVEALSRAVTQLDQFTALESARIRRFHEVEITDVEAESVLLKCFDREILSHRLLPLAIREWRNPPHEEFKPRTLWSLENALTGTLAHVQRSNPQRFCSLSLELQGLLAEVAGPNGTAGEAPAA